MPEHLAAGRLFAVRQSAIATGMTSDPDSSISLDRRTIDKHDLVRIGLVWAALLMNFFLALANANGVGMTANIVLAVQLLLTGCAILVLLCQPPPINAGFVIPMIIVIIGYFVSGLYHGSIDPRGIYDISIIPIFMMLGMTLNKLRPWMLNIPMGAIVLVALADGLLRDQFASIVNPLGYYRSTRAWVASQDVAYVSDSGLYVGADRPGGLIFSFISDHRVGSIFLEPLSLGYFAVIMTIGYAVVYERARRQFLIGCSVCFFLAILADTRTAAFLVVLTAIIVISAKKIPKVFVYFVPPIIMIVGALAYIKTGGGGGDLIFRLGLTYKEFFRSDSLSLLVGDVSSDQIYDSGVINIIQSVGLISALALIYLISGVVSFPWRKYSYVPFVTIIYIMVTLLFGGAVFSIKTAAMLGIVLGRSGRSSDVTDDRRLLMEDRLGAP